MNSIKVSKTHSINTECFGGQGLIVNRKDGFPCSVGCEEQFNGVRRYSQVFAVVRHKELGLIAVTPDEFNFLGLPEIAGFPQT